MRLATQLFLTVFSIVGLALIARSQVTQPAKLECDPATALSSPPEGACHYDCGGHCPVFLREQNVQVGACVVGEVKCRTKASGATLNLYWYDCVVNYSAECTPPQIACKWQVDSGSGHQALMYDCENY